MMMNINNTVLCLDMALFYDYMKKILSFVVVIAVQLLLIFDVLNNNSWKYEQKSRCNR